MLLDVILFAIVGAIVFGIFGAIGGALSALLTYDPSRTHISRPPSR